jgi:hypothetical protein
VYDEHYWSEGEFSKRWREATEIEVFFGGACSDALDGVLRKKETKMYLEATFGMNVPLMNGSV